MATHLHDGAGRLVNEGSHQNNILNLTIQCEQGKDYQQAKANVNIALEPLLERVMALNKRSYLSYLTYHAD